jgi:hypothetical protein
MVSLSISSTMIGNNRQLRVDEGVEVALQDRHRPRKAPQLSDKQCAKVIATVDAAAPAAYVNWTLRLLGAVGLCRLFQP